METTPVDVAALQAAIQERDEAIARGVAELNAARAQLSEAHIAAAAMREHAATATRDATAAALQGAHAASQSAIRAPKPPTPQRFSGVTKYGVSVETWLFQVEHFNKQTKMPPQDWVGYAGSLLTDAAATWWRFRCQRRGPDDFGTWLDFSAEARQAFAKVNSEQEAAYNVSRLIQRRDVQDYINQFRNYCLEIPDMQEPEQKRRFIAGLKTDIRRHVELQNPETLDDCFRIAQRVDSINFASRNRQQHDPFRSYNSPGATPMELGYLDTDQDPDGGAAQPPSSDIIAATAFRSNQPQRTRLTPEERAHLIKNNGCLYCRKLGHWAGDCPVKLQRFGSTDYRPNFNANGPSRQGNGPPRR